MKNVMVPLGTIASAVALVLCLPGPVWGQAEFAVGIVGRNVTLTCPTTDASWWKKKGNRQEDLNCSSPSCTIADYQGTQLTGQYGCASSGTSIYLHVKDCPDCMEMSLGVVMGVIVADLLFTLGVLILTHYCSRKRANHFGGSPAAGGPRARPRGQREDRPPPVPNPDYEPIRKGQREVYAGLEPRAF